MPDGPNDKLPDRSDRLIRTLLGPSLQGGAARMILGLAAFSAMGAGVAWLVLR